MDTAVQHQSVRRVFVFSVSVRIFHWINALCILILIATGLIMANPPAIQQGHEASFGYWFGTVRFIHFATAYVFTAAFVYRIYLMFAGNRYERWRNFVPTSWAFIKEIGQVIRFDVLLKKNVKHFAIGHNALAGFSYLILFIAMAIMVFTGFALYSNMSTAWFPQLFDWVTGLLGGDIMVRIVHHVAMWIFILFILVHVYLVFYHDYVEGRGEISSMGGGWKFVNEDVLQKHLEEERAEKEAHAKK
jgi:Ni/Fe-hydrogenase 1 B-type cytochrome subunit